MSTIVFVSGWRALLTRLMGRRQDYVTPTAWTNGKPVGEHRTRVYTWGRWCVAEGR